MDTKLKPAEETRAEAEALRAELQRQLEETFREEYQTRLLKMVGLFMKHEPSNVKVESDGFVFDNEQYEQAFLYPELPDLKSSDVMGDLERVERWFNRYVQQLEEVR